MPPLRRRTPRSEVEDEELMRQYVDGDSDAFDELFKRYEPRAFSFFLKRTHSRDRAQDLYQELFLRVHRARDSFDSGRPFAPWFFQIAHRLLVDDQRRAYRSHEVSIEGREHRSLRARARDEVADREQLGQILGGLSAEERFVLISAKMQGAGYPEVAAHLGKSVDAVKKLASRAMRRVRDASFPMHASIAQRPH